MKLTVLDISIVILYLATMVAIGWVLRKRARKNKESYLKAANQLAIYFTKNFEKYSGLVSKEIIEAGPKIN